MANIENFALGLNINPEEEEKIDVFDQNNRNQQFNYQKVLANKKKPQQGTFSERIKILPNSNVIERAKIHGKATIIAFRNEDEKTTEDQYCDCCGNTFETNPIPMCNKNEDFGFLGSAFPMYFKFIKYSALVLTLMFVISGIFQLYTNMQGKACRKEPITADECNNKSQNMLNFLLDKLLDENERLNICISNIATKYSLYNKNGNFEVQLQQEYFNFLFIFVFFIILQILRKKSQNYEEQIDENIITPSDYTVMIENLPKNQTNIQLVVDPEIMNHRYSQLENKIMTFMNMKAKAVLKNQNKKFVNKVNLAYDISDYADQLREISAKKTEKQQILSYQEKNDGQLPDGKSLVQITKEIEVIQLKIQKYENDADKGVEHLFTGIAFISFETEQDSKLMVSKFKRSLLGQLILMVQTTIAWVPDNALVLGNQRLQIQRAPEPTDILWENVGISYMKRFGRRFQTFIYSIIVWLVCFGIIFGAAVYKESLRRDGSKKSTLTTILSYATGLIITIINFVLGKLMRKFGAFELHSTWTGYHISCAEKLSLAQFVNTGIIVLFTNYYFRSIGDTGGLIEDIFYILIMNLVVNNLMKFFNPFWYLRLKKRKKLIAQAKEDPKGHSINWEYAKLVFEGSPCDMSQNYAGIIKTIFICAFYSSVMPLANVIGVMTLFVTYWADKYQLLRRHKEPKMLGRKLMHEMVDFLDYIPLFFLAGNVFFFRLQSVTLNSINNQELQDGSNPIHDIAFLAQGELHYQIEIQTWQRYQMILCLIYYTTPIVWIVKSCFKKNIIITNKNQLSYTQARMSEFTTEYDRVNPITQQEAIAEALEDYIYNAKSDKNADIGALEMMQKQLKLNLLGAGKLGMVGQYATNNLPLQNIHAPNPQQQPQQSLVYFLTFPFSQSCLKFTQNMGLNMLGASNIFQNAFGGGGQMPTQRQKTKKRQQGIGNMFGLNNFMDTTRNQGYMNVPQQEVLYQPSQPFISNSQIHPQQQQNLPLQQSNLPLHQTDRQFGQQLEMQQQPQKKIGNFYD